MVKSDKQPVVGLTAALKNKEQVLLLIRNKTNNTQKEEKIKQKAWKHYNRRSLCTANQKHKYLTCFFTGLDK